MITSIVPPTDTVCAFQRMLADEYGKASNMNRQSVEDAIVKVQQRLTTAWLCSRG